MTRRAEQIAPNAHPVDVHVGARIRAARKSVGMSQDHLAKAVGVTFQQLQKYESGINRISGSRLYDVACELKLPPGYFYEGLPDPAAGRQLAALVPSNLLLEDALDAVPEIKDVGRLSSDMQRSLRTVLRTMLDTLPKAA